LKEFCNNDKKRAKAFVSKNINLLMTMPKQNIHFAQQITQLEWWAASDTAVSWCSQHAWKRTEIFQSSREE
jgi:hypothetical protein